KDLRINYWITFYIGALLHLGVSCDQLTAVKTEESKGESVTLTCRYETTDTTPVLFWYRQHSDLQAPQFILWKGARGNTGENIPDKRYESSTSQSETQLTIKSVTLADTALYYCRLIVQYNCTPPILFWQRLSYSDDA
uniref:Ig-like domain-containing protein n=1 Tax=Mola mola TaxID=94237 RepID=A0A3Q3XDC0_MOLML